MPFGGAAEDGTGGRGRAVTGNGGEGVRRLDAGAVEELCTRFEAEHLARYGHAFSGEFPVEIVNLRLVGTRRPAGIVEPAPFDAATRAGPETRRGVYFGPAAGLVDTAGHRSRKARAGAQAPARSSSRSTRGRASCRPDCTARLDRLGNVIIDLPAAPAASPASERAG